MKKIVLASALFLSGCVSMSERIANATPATPAMKAQIVEGARNHMRDPYSIRDAEISYVWKHPTGTGLLVCARGNAKNGFGGYTGRQAHLISFTNDGRIANFFADNATCGMDGIRWQPFPEIYALRSL